MNIVNAINIVKKQKCIYLTTDDRLCKLCDSKHPDFEIMSNVEEFNYEECSRKCLVKTKSCEFYIVGIDIDTMNIQDVKFIKYDVPKHANIMGQTIVWDTSCMQLLIPEIEKLPAKVIVYDDTCFVCENGAVYMSAGLARYRGKVKLPKKTQKIVFHSARCVYGLFVSIDKKLYVFDDDDGNKFTRNLTFIPDNIMMYDSRSVMIKSPKNEYFKTSVDSYFIINYIVLEKMNFRHATRDILIFNDYHIRYRRNVYNKCSEHLKPYDNDTLIDENGTLWEFGNKNLINSGFVIKSK